MAMQRPRAPWAAPVNRAEEGETEGRGGKVARTRPPVRKRGNTMVFWVPCRCRDHSAAPWLARRDSKKGQRDERFLERRRIQPGTTLPGNACARPPAQAARWSASTARSRCRAAGPRPKRAGPRPRLRSGRCPGGSVRARRRSLPAACCRRAARLGSTLGFAGRRALAAPRPRRPAPSAGPVCGGALTHADAPDFVGLRQRPRDFHRITTHPLWEPAGSRCG